MGDANYYSSGNWNFYCQLCGKKNKSQNSMKTWDGFRVCKHHKEVRNPQDFQVPIVDNQTVPWSVPDNSNSNPPGPYVPPAGAEGAP